MGSRRIAPLPVWLAGVLLTLTVIPANAELTPPYFNLATGRKIYATATCGSDTDGPELYCKLVGANTENDPFDYSVIQGQVRMIWQYVYMIHYGRSGFELVLAN